ncbi:MAG TPA: arginine--tRNA ligase [Solirubrobacterales bacterium]|nr:arginine--tRNA ligase [Solirubrobacterales bacterium]
MTPLDDLRATVEAAAADLRDGAAPPRARASFERPKQAGFGDYSTNAAMLLAPALKAPPREIAERLGQRVRERLGDAVEKVEVAGPGFLNVFLADRWYVDSTGEMLAAGEAWGTTTPDVRERVNVEYVSANPTGPLTAASGRHAAFGDALARLLALAGHEVSREYYFNDAGSQVDRLGVSVRARARHEPVPEDGYQGDYVADLAAQIPDAAHADPVELGHRAAGLLMERIRETLKAYRVEFDTWFSERQLHTGDPSAIARGYARLREQGHLYESEGALWLRTTTFGDDKDRVLQRSTGAPTYFAADVAYQEDKFRRGFDRLVYVLGADHHGYIARLKAISMALGEDPEKVEIPILQFVHIVEGGGRKGMSKRRGDFVTLDKLIGSIGVDATRWFMISRSHDSTIDLDLELARRQDPENPVYYVQYAHARIASILRKAGEGAVPTAVPAPSGRPPMEESEKVLVKRLLEFPEEVRIAAQRRAPHRICAYSTAVAADFHAFYRDCQVVGAEGEGVESSRLGLCLATKRTIAAALGLLGISAPERM